MPTFDDAVTVAAPIETVWAYYQKVREALPALSPAEAGLRVESVAPEPAQKGTVVTITAKAPLVGRITWVAEYIGFQAPAKPDGGGPVAGFFTDLQRKGPFKAWQHTHGFEALDAGRTRLTDHVEYRVPGGPLAGVADALIVRGQLKKMFDHRRAVLVGKFGKG